MGWSFLLRLHLHLEMATAFDLRRYRELAILQVALVCRETCFGPAGQQKDSDLPIRFCFFLFPVTATLGFLSFDPRRMTAVDSRPVLIVDSFAARSSPSAGSIDFLCLCPNWIGFLIGPAGFAVAVVVADSAAVDLCCRNYSAIEIAAGPDLDSVLRRLAAGSSCSAAVVAAAGSAFASDAASTARFSF